MDGSNGHTHLIDRERKGKLPDLRTGLFYCTNVRKGNGGLINTGPRQQQGQARERFSIRLDARDPARGCFRAYRIEAGTDLLGDWLVDVTYGRIGTPGRMIRHVAGDEAQARKIVRHCLQRRATAPRRTASPTSSPT